MNPKRQGFTLVEMMIAVAIGALLLAVALPNYRSYLEKGRRTDARNALLDLASRQEKHFSTNNVYTANPSELGLTGTTFPVAARSSGTTYYLLGLTLAADRQSWTATATPQSSQTRDGCATYTLTSLGVQGNTGNSVPTASCW